MNDETGQLGDGVAPPISEDRQEFVFRRLTELPLAGIPSSAEEFLKIDQKLDLQIDLSNPIAVNALVEVSLSGLPDNEARVLREMFSDPETDVTAALGELDRRTSAIRDEQFVMSYYRRFIAAGVEQLATQFAELVNNPDEKRRTRGTIVFVCRKSYNLVLREARLLRARGYRCFLLHLSSISEEMKPTFHQSFDQLIDGISSYVSLRPILDLLDVDIFHVQCHMWEFMLGRFVLEHRGHAKVVCEFYDITSIYAERDDLARSFWNEIVDLDLAMERYIFNHAHGVIHRFPSEIIARLQRRCGTQIPEIELQSYASLDLTHYTSAKHSDGGDRLKLVYIGGLIPRLGNVPPEMFPEWTHIETWELLLEQGFDIDVFSSPFRPPVGPGFEQFHALADRHLGFRLLHGVPEDQLAKTIAKYDFGLILALMDRETSLCTADQFDGGVGTKLFAYLEAGLPVLVNAEYTYMSKIVEDNCLGLALSSEMIDRAGPLIRSYDRAGALKRIQEYNQLHSMESEIQRVVDLYERI